MTVNVKRIVLYYGFIFMVSGRVSFPSMIIASPVKLTNGVKTLLNRSVGNRIRKKVE